MYRAHVEMIASRGTAQAKPRAPHRAELVESFSAPVSLTQDEFRTACAHFATGVAILTTQSADSTPHGLTINSFASLSLDPLLVMAAVAHSSAQLHAFESSTSFAVNILREDQADLSRRFAKVPE